MRLTSRSRPRSRSYSRRSSSQGRTSLSQWAAGTNARSFRACDVTTGRSRTPRDGQWAMCEPFAMTFAIASGHLSSAKGGQTDTALDGPRPPSGWVLPAGLASALVIIAVVFPVSAMLPVFDLLVGSDDFAAQSLGRHLDLALHRWGDGQIHLPLVTFAFDFLDATLIAPARCVVNRDALHLLTIEGSRGFGRRRCRLIDRRWRLTHKPSGATGDQKRQEQGGLNGRHRFPRIVGCGPNLNRLPQESDQHACLHATTNAVVIRRPESKTACGSRPRRLTANGRDRQASNPQRIR